MITAVLVLSLAASSAPVAPSAAERFLEDLRCALARRDRAGVAAMFEYPATIIARGARVPVADRATLIKVFDLAFPPELQGVVAMARVRRDGQLPPRYPVRLDGASLTIGDAWLWARRAGSRYRIARIILPAAWVAIGRASIASPTRITMWPERPATFVSGMLNPFEMQSYIIGTEPGQRLELKLDGFPGRDVVMRVLDLKTGRPLDEKAADGTRLWTAIVDSGGDVRIDVVRLSPENRPVPLYVLAAGLR